MNCEAMFESKIFNRRGMQLFAAPSGFIRLRKDRDNLVLVA